jgi:hypothetical protein
MPFTKMHNWDPDPSADGAPPGASERCEQMGMQMVRMSDADGEWCGYEAGDGTLMALSRVTTSPAKQADIDQKQIEIQGAAADAKARRLTLEALAAKREAGTPLTAADQEAICDLVLGRQPT